MAQGVKTGGRKKGARNKTTVMAKDAIALVGEKLGGVDRMVAWAKEDSQNERVFWGTIYPKLLPLQLTGEGGGPIQIRASKEQRDAAVSAALRANTDA